MKKLITFVYLGLFALTITRAQTNAEASPHLSFKGVPIDGKLDAFVSKMKSSGFNLTGREEGTAILEGDFASYKNCFIAVSTLKTSDLVSKISVVFPGHDNWSSLSINYFNIKEMLSEKYGKPYESVEKFQSYSQPDNDRDKMYYLKRDQCKYYSNFETEKGTIQLSIDHDGMKRFFVKLGYFDKINSEVVKKQALEDL